jgi:hypothetical protein
MKQVMNYHIAHLFCRLSMASTGPELDLEFLTSRKDKVEVPKGIHTPMCYCGDNCKLVKCNVLGYRYRMRFFMCENYEHDPSHHVAMLDQK